MANNKGITQHFGANLAELLADKILNVYKDFPKTDYVNTIKKSIDNSGYTQRIELHADGLYKYLPKDYEKSSEILISILGEETKMKRECSLNTIGLCQLESMLRNME